MFGVCIAGCYDPDALPARFLPMIPDKTRRTTPALGAAWRAALGLGVGLGTWFLAAMMTGAGHGTAALMPSSLAVLTLPCSAIAAAFFQRRWALHVGLLAAGGVLASDVAIGLLLAEEGDAYLEHVWSTAPEPLASWALLWIAVHAASIRALVPVVRRRRAGPLERIDGYGRCEHCAVRFPYALVHSGFNYCAYAYCSTCGRTALLDGWHLPDGSGIAVHRAITEDVESSLLPCECGGRFRASAAPRCPACKGALSAELAAAWLEPRVTWGRGWRWQRSWNGLLALVIDGRVARDVWTRPQEPDS